MAMLSRNHGPSTQATAAWVLLAVAVLPATAASEPQVTVREDRGSYSVAATFDVSQPASAVVAVLTDYEQIPRFMPGVRTSIVLERGGGRTVVEQEAVARLMMFSKRIHLVLERDSMQMIESLRAEIAARPRHMATRP